MSKSKPRHDTANLWAALRDTTIHSMNKGQLPFFALAALAALIVLKIPGDKVHELLLQTIRHLKSGVFWSYILNAFLVLGWAIHARRGRRKYAQELDRLGEEKSELQSLLLNRKLSSAKKS